MHKYIYIKKSIIDLADNPGIFLGEYSHQILT